VLSCERITKNNNGPKANLNIVNGKIYGISIDVPYPYALDGYSGHIDPHSGILTPLKVLFQRTDVV
jgi:hypothetical protein